MAEKFVNMLKGESNSLGRTEEVVDIVIKSPAKMGELFDLYFQDDEWVRLRTSSALKRIWRYDKEMIEPYVQQWVSVVSKIDQASVNWTFAQMVEECSVMLSKDQLDDSIRRLKCYLDSSNDWIVLCCSMDALGMLALDRPELTNYLGPCLKRLAKDSRKSVSKRAKKTQARLAEYKIRP